MRRMVVLVVLVGCGRIGFPTLSDDAGGGGRPDAPTTCAPPYTPVGTKCYRFVATLTTWLGAEKACEADTVDSHLVVIDSVPDHETIHNLAMAGHATDVWVGYTDRVSEGNWRWVASSGLDPSPNFCFLGAAVNTDAVDCITQDAQGACPDWRYRNCDDLHAYVCQRDGSSPDPMAY